MVNKDMTYVKQLDAYEEAVMQKRHGGLPCPLLRAAPHHGSPPPHHGSARRLEELPESELAKLMGEVEAEKEARAAAGKPPRQ